MKLRTKTSLLMATLVALTLGLCGMFFLRQLETSIRHNIIDGAQSIASTARDSIATFMADSLRDTQAIAHNIPHQALQQQDQAAIETYLASMLDIYPKFANGMWILDAQGKLIVDHPRHPEIHGDNFAFRPYFQRTMREKQGIIGVPYISARTKKPVLTFTAYLKGADDKPLGMLGCAIVLTSPNALGGISNEKFGNSGYIYVFDQSRRIILHPEADRILQRDVPPGSNKLFDAAIEGIEQTGETVNSRGIAMLASFKMIPATNWVVAAQQPIEEVHRPLVEARRNILFIGIFFALAAALIGALAIRRVTRPLTQLSRAVQGLDLASPDQNSADQDQRHAALTKISTTDEIGELAQAYCQLRRDLGQALDSLHRRAREWERTFDSVQDPMFILDQSQRIRQANLAAAELFQQPRAELLGQRCCQLVHGTEVPPAECAHHLTVASQLPARIERITPCLPGVFEESTSLLTDDSGAPVGTVHIFRDLTQSRQAEAEIKRLAYYDQLTGLPNRSWLQSHLSRIIATTIDDDDGFALLFMDLDRFKVINDILGHSAGDEMLTIIAERLTRVLRKTDTVARLGGDEFVMVFTDETDHEQIALITQKVLQSVAEPMILSGQQAFATGSIGIAIYPQDGRDFDTLLKNADIAMYQAKAQGSDGHKFFTQEMNWEAMERLILGTRLPHALENNEFFLEYQPVFDLQSDRISGVEALVRWQHPDLGTVSPGKFIPLAEESGLILPLGEWVLYQACLQAVALGASTGDAFLISVNLSGRQLKQPDLVSTVRRTLQETGLEPSRLKLELTESVLLENADSAIEILKQLRSLGIQIAMDDFGTVYSSLNYLKKLPIDILKIDRSFIRDIETDTEDASIVDIIIKAAQSLGLKVIAEGVETEGQLNFLRSRRCDQVQGFYFARPLPPQQLAEMLYQKNTA